MNSISTHKLESSLLLAKAKAAYTTGLGLFILGAFCTLHFFIKNHPEAAAISLGGGIITLGLSISIGKHYIKQEQLLSKPTSPEQKPTSPEQQEKELLYRRIRALPKIEGYTDLTIEEWRQAVDSKQLDTSTTLFRFQMARRAKLDKFQESITNDKNTTPRTDNMRMAQIKQKELVYEIYICVISLETLDALKMDKLEQCRYLIGRIHMLCDKLEGLE